MKHQHRGHELTIARLDPRQTSLFGPAHEKELQKSVSPLLSSEWRLEMASLQQTLEWLQKVVAEGSTASAADQLLATGEIFQLKQRRERLLHGINNL